MKKILLLLLVCVVFAACFPIRIPTRIKKNFVCNEGRYTGLDTLININGIYYIPELTIKYDGYKPTQEKDTFYMCFMFWNDGTAADNIGEKPYRMQTHFDEILAEIEKGKKDSFISAVYWGNYRIIGDTIRFWNLYVPYFVSLNDSWRGYETCFKIIDKNTLEYLPMLSKNLDPWVKTSAGMDDQDKYPTKAIFLPIERIPPPNCWLKKKKWFWCNEEDWKEYKKRNK